MYISAIQGQLTNSTKGMQAKKTSQPVGLTKDLMTDSFSREKMANKVAFTGEGAAKGTLGGLIIGSLVAVAVIVTGGAAAPVAAVYFGSTLGGAAAGGVIGKILED